MPSIAAQLLVSAAAAQFSFHGEAATYVPDPGAADPGGAGGAGASIQIIAGPITDSIHDREQGRVDLQSRQVTVRRADVPTPGRGDTFTLAADGSIWTVDTILDQNPTLAILQCVRPITVELTTPHYRDRT